VSDDDLVPASVRLGAVVPPEDPEDWTRPLTWVAALGMLAPALVTLAWLVAAPPADARPQALTALVAATLAGGAAATGATQIGRFPAFAATLGGALFGALATVVVAAALAGSSPGSAPGSPALGHAVVAATAGLGGASASAIVAAAGPRTASRPVRAALAIPVAIAVALVVLGLVSS
jgi:hypothetical protein